jgi:hypothetical protein
MYLDSSINTQSNNGTNVIETFINNANVYSYDSKYTQIANLNLRPGIVHHKADSWISTISDHYYVKGITPVLNKYPAVSVN